MQKIRVATPIAAFVLAARAGGRAFAAGCRGPYPGGEMLAEAADMSVKIEPQA